MTGPSEAVISVALVVAFASLVTVHVATVYGLFAKRAFGFATAGLLLPPAAPVGAFARGMRVRGILWLVAMALYVTAFLLAR